MVLSSIVSYFIIKSESPLGELLNVLTLSPAALPGIVVATAFLWLFLTYNFLGLYGTIWIIMLALTARFIVYGSRAMNSSFRSLDDRLEEAAQMSGASLWTIFREIFAPLVKPGFVAGYILLFIDYAKVVTIPLFLTGQENQVLSVMLWQVAFDGKDEVSAAIAVIMIVFVLSIYTAVHLFTEIDVTRI